jgi:hypothetical protein
VSLTPVTNLQQVSLTPVSLIPAANLPLVSTTLAKLVANFAASVVDTGGKFATGVVGKYLREFSEKFETVLMGYSGAWGKLIHEKNQKQKIS